MVNPSHIPHLLKLLDDDSADVQEAVARELFSFGSLLHQEIQKQSIALTVHQKRLLNKILLDVKTKEIKKNWPSWFDVEDSSARLEKALTIISEYLNEYVGILPLNVILDDL